MAHNPDFNFLMVKTSVFMFFKWFLPGSTSAAGSSAAGLGRRTFRSRPSGRCCRSPRRIGHQPTSEVSLTCRCHRRWCLRPLWLLIWRPVDGLPITREQVRLFSSNLSLAGQYQNLTRPGDPVTLCKLMMNVACCSFRVE